MDQISAAPNTNRRKFFAFYEITIEISDGSAGSFCTWLTVSDLLQNEQFYDAKSAHLSNDRFMEYVEYAVTQRYEGDNSAYFRAIFWLVFEAVKESPRRHSRNPLLAVMPIKFHLFCLNFSLSVCRPPQNSSSR